MNPNLSGHVLVPDTISGRVNRLPLKAKLAWGYIMVFTLLFAIGFTAVFIAFTKNRREEFYQRIKDRLQTTEKLLIDVDQIDNRILKLLDENTINSLYDEEILLFDSSASLIYASVSKPHLAHAKFIIDQLKGGKSEIKITEGQYELLGIRFYDSGKITYGIARAYDRFGRNKVAFLGNAMIATFIILGIVLTIASLALARYITAPITKLTTDIEDVSPGNLSVRIRQLNTNDEIALLTDKFNELLEKLEGAFKFQHHFIQHVSHELKTPLAIMIANVENAITTEDPEKVKEILMFQKNGMMELSHIINAMLDISKAENRLMEVMPDSEIRIDELLFECIDEAGYINPGRQIDFEFEGSIKEEKLLTVQGNYRMLKMAFINLLKNAIYYSSIENPVVQVISENENIIIRIINDGATVAEQERLKMFMHLFRGSNSFGKRGFGLGLALVERIIKLHNGTITYTVTGEGKNCFTVKLPAAH